jgi:hypothetical protein
MTRDELTRLRNVSIAPNAIDPIWLRQAVREIDELRAALDGVCRLYEESERRYREREAQLALRRVNARRSF